jgi:ABC-type multidrug transport system fused ATPase/permease subunit
MRPQRNAPGKTVHMIRTVRPLVWALARPRLGRLCLVLLLIMVSRAASLVLPASTKYLVDDVVVSRDVGLLVPLTLAIIGAAVIAAALHMTAWLLLTSEGLQLVAEMRRRVQNHVGRLPLSFYDANRSGALARRIMEDPVGVRNLFGVGLAEFVGTILTGVYSLIFLLRISPLLTMTALGCAGIFWLISRQGFRRVHPLFAHQLTTAAEVSGRLTESIAGVCVIKGFHAEAHETRVFASEFERLRAASMRSTTVSSMLRAATTVVASGITAVIIYLAAHEIFAGRMTLGEMVTFMAFLTFLIAPVQELPALGTTIAEALASLTHLQELLRQPPEDETVRRTRQMEPIVGHVSFRDVCFSYDGRDAVLHNIDFDAAPGTATALVGPSGSGKSTIISLIAAFYDPSSGKISVDGVDLPTVRLDSYRRQLGVVLQDTFLFDGTIRENVAFARPEARDADVLEACRIAHVHEFAERLPHGYDTRVGERGVRLSMGQRQRISIARALLADPRILILDEATSSLDSESEAAIQDGLAHLLKGRTSFIVAHRLSTIHRVDQILFLERGRLIEHGTHTSLLARRGRYYELAFRQDSQSGTLVLPSL